jgi:hypothetical protein
VLSFAVVALASVLYTPVIARAQSKTPPRKVAAKTSKPAAKPAATAATTTAASAKLSDGKQVYSRAWPASIRRSREANG